MSGAPSKPRVIVADDEPVITHTIEHILNSHGFEARGVMSGEEAVEVARKFAPDILVSDIRMGNLDGIQAAYRVRRIHPACKVVLFSANVLDDLQLKKIRLLGFDFLRKPLHPIGLLTHLRMLDARFMEEIPPDDGLRVLRNHCDRDIELLVEGRLFDDEEREVFGRISRVMPTDMCISMRFTESDRHPERVLWLNGGRFHYAAMADCPTVYAPPWRSVLQVEFEDGSEMVFRERW
jgi:DNA-binding response OmpR family regulator